MDIKIVVIRWVLCHSEEYLLEEYSEKVTTPSEEHIRGKCRASAIATYKNECKPITWSTEGWLVYGKPKHGSIA